VLSPKAEIQTDVYRDVFVVVVAEAEAQLKDEEGGDGADDAGHGGVGQGLIFDLWEPIKSFQQTCKPKQAIKKANHHLLTVYFYIFENLYILFLYYIMEIP